MKFSGFEEFKYSRSLRDKSENFKINFNDGGLECSKGIFLEIRV